MYNIYMYPKRNYVIIIVIIPWDLREINSKIPIETEVCGYSSGFSKRTNHGILHALSVLQITHDH